MVPMDNKLLIYNQCCYYYFIFMDYFISFETCPFNEWQMELLLESFKKHELTENLMLATTRKNCISYWSVENLKNHPHKIIHENIGDKKGYLPLNDIYSLIWCLEKEKISMPLAIIPPHSVIKKPLPKFNEDNKSIVFLYQVDPFFTFEQAEKNTGEFWKNYKEKKHYMENWANLGTIMVMDNMPKIFFMKVAKIMEELIVHQIMEKKPIWEHTNRLAWTICLADNKEDIQIFTPKDLITMMLSQKDGSIIDYQMGLPPIFSLSMFRFPEPDYFSFGDPIKILSDCIQTPNSHYISNLATKILMERKNAK